MQTAQLRKLTSLLNEDSQTRANFSVNFGQLDEAQEGDCPDTY
tara:strand:+ start:742 stop:870 length:129 start_codon:yes stop_codon:yes gene_type:complete